MRQTNQLKKKKIKQPGSTKHVSKVIEQIQNLI